MARPTLKERTVTVLMERYGETYADELSISVDRNTPSPLFRLLCAALLFSARIRAEAATTAARALSRQGWTTPRNMAASTWEERTLTLNENGYARYDERTARMLGDTAQKLLDEYGGDLRRLRDAADHDPDEERRRLKAFKGIGDVGVDIFFREVQIAWEEHYPFVDKTAAKAAERLGLPKRAKTLSGLVERDEFPRLVAALVRAELANAYEDIKAEAKAR